MEYQSIFGFGQKTGIDLPGEANTSGLVYTLDNITKIDLATNSFGQNYNCTMIEMASAFSSLVNGGTYYQPHLVTKVTDSKGNTISKTDNSIVKQTVSKATSDLLKQYLQSVVSSGSGKTAKVDGYSMGGKTGTAQKYDNETHQRKQGSYLVSFIGCVPAEDPQLVIYCVLDEPNVEDEAHSSYAQNIVREILKEVLPYMNIYPDEELTGINENLTITGTDIFDTPIDESVGEGDIFASGDEEDVPQNDPSEDTPGEDTPAEDTPPENDPAESDPQN